MGVVSSTVVALLVASASCVVVIGDGEGSLGLGGLMDRLRSMLPWCDAEALSSSLLWQQAPLVSGEQLDRAVSRW